jgi:hypothetical protein
MAMLGLIGGPLIVASGIAIMFDVIERGPRCRASRRFIWELSFGIYRSGCADEAGSVAASWNAEASFERP